MLIWDGRNNVGLVRLGRASACVKDKWNRVVLRREFKAAKEEQQHECKGARIHHSHIFVHHHHKKKQSQEEKQFFTTTYLRLSIENGI